MSICARKPVGCRGLGPAVSANLFQPAAALWSGRNGRARPGDGLFPPSARLRAIRRRFPWPFILSEMRRCHQIGSGPAAALLLLASLLALDGCNRPPDDPATRLLRQLPAEQALYVYLDLGRIRQSPSLEPLLRNGNVFPTQIRAWAQTAGLDYRADVDAVALSLGTKGTNLAVRGRFDEAALRQALEGAGAVCPAVAATGSVQDRSRRRRAGPIAAAAGR